jgi:hypothetical protein
LNGNTDSRNDLWRFTGSELFQLPESSSSSGSEESENIPEPSSENENADTDDEALPAILGGSIGGGVLLVAVIVVTAVLLSRRKRSRKDETQPAVELQDKEKGEESNTQQNKKFEQDFSLLNFFLLHFQNKIQFPMKDLKENQ